MNSHFVFWTGYYAPLWEAGKFSKEDATYINEFLSGPWEDSGEKIPFQEESFCLKVCYPGLVNGLGYTHECGLGSKKAKEIVMGISLDFVTGLPYLPGSSVKGILRTPFLENADYILDRMGKPPGDIAFVRELEADIFGRKHPKDYRNAPKKDTVQGRDCFLDAFPVCADNKKSLLGLDNITPHRPMKEPKVLQMIKIMPDVEIQFRFRLRDSVIAGITVSREDKLRLFSNILIDLGAGAKTKTGYGLLDAMKETRKNYTFLTPCK